MEKINKETGEFETVEVVNENLPIDINIEPIVEYKALEIKFNYEELKNMMTTGLEDYKIQVNYDNLKEANKMATKLNKLAGTIKRARIDNKKEMLEPLTDFESKMKDLEDTAQKGREFILNQVNVFNDELKSICKLELEKLLQEKYEEKEIAEEFKTLDISDLAIVSNISESMKLTKKAKGTIETRVNMQLTAQTNKKMRLMMLENECLKAGLKVLLNENDVASFILESDLKYNEQLSILINRELDKQKQIELNLEAERQKKEELQRLQKEAEERRLEAERQAEELEEQRKKDIEIQKVQDVQKETGVKKVVYVATFEFEVPLNISNEDIKAKYDLKMKEFSNTFIDSEVL